MAGISGMNSFGYQYFLNQNKGSSSPLNSMYGLMNNHASIRNGSYGKVLKATYSDNPVKAPVTTIKPPQNVGTDKELNAAKNDAAALKKAAADMSTGKSDPTYDNVNKFVNAYNSVVESAGDSKVSSVSRGSQSMVNWTSNMSKVLDRVGISINKDNTLSLDKATFEKASANDIKALFSGNSSYGSTVAAKASSIQQNAAFQSVRPNVYNGFGGFSQSNQVGLLFNDFA